MQTSIETQSTGAGRGAEHIRPAPPNAHQPGPPSPNAAKSNNFRERRLSLSDIDTTEFVPMSPSPAGSVMHGSNRRRMRNISMRCVEIRDQTPRAREREFDNCLGVHSR